MDGRKGCNKRIYASYTLKDWMEEVEGKNYPEANTGCIVKEENSKCIPSFAGQEGWRLYFPL